MAIIDAYGGGSPKSKNKNTYNGSPLRNGEPRYLNNSIKNQISPANLLTR
jgi:hypothetical protein